MMALLQGLLLCGLSTASDINATLQNSLLPYTCPQGFDCWNQNSCPSPIAACPAGYFCNDPGLFASIAPDNDYEFERDTWCPGALHCPSTSEAFECPEDRYCDQGSQVGTKCDPAAICPEGSLAQARFLPTIVMVIIVTGVFFLSYADPGCKGDEGIQRIPRSPAASAAAKFSRINFRTKSLSVTLPSGKRILHPISVNFNAGELIAIMGPSGAGKTTVMRALMTNEHEGDLYINGTLASKVPYQSLIGFVPQDDIVDSSLTPREILMYSAFTRLPKTLSFEEITARVDEVLKLLGLRHVQNTRVGDKVSRGLSGGEKKRVSIGIELIANPSALFLDEPTSGLDASSAERLATTLSEVASTGRCVVAIIHQPRYDSYRKFNKLLLLGRGGHAVYFGPSEGVGKYFAGLDSELACPPQTNVANHVLDIVSGVFDKGRNRNAAERRSTLLGDGISETKSQDESSPSDGKDILEKSSDHHKAKSDSKSNISIEAGIHQIKDGDSEEGGTVAKVNRKILAKDFPVLWTMRQKNKVEDEKGVEKQLEKESMKRVSISYFRTWNAMMLRAALMEIRNLSSIKLYIFLNILLSLVLSVAFSPYLQGRYIWEPALPQSLVAYCPNFVDCNISRRGAGIEQLMFFMNLAVPATSVMVGAGLFSGDILFLKREGSSGVPVWLQAFSKMLINMIPIIIYNTVFTACWILLGHSGSTNGWFSLFIALGFASSGVGCAISLAVSQQNLYLVSLIVCFVFAAFSGIYPRLNSVGDAEWIWDLSFARWSSEAAFTLYTEHYADEGLDVSRPAAEQIGYTLGRFDHDIGALWALGFAGRIIGMITLVRVAQPAAKRIEHDLIMKFKSMLK